MSRHLSTKYWQEIGMVAATPSLFSFTKDIMPSSSWLTNELVVVGSIGGNAFGGHSNEHFSQTDNVDMLKNMRVINSTFHFEHPPTNEDVELLEQKHEYKYSEKVQKKSSHSHAGK